MPKVNHDFRGNKPPTLQMLKSERVVLLNASKLLATVSALVTGHNTELALETGELAAKLDELAKIEQHDLTKPF